MFIIFHDLCIALCGDRTKLGACVRRVSEEMCSTVSSFKASLGKETLQDWHDRCENGRKRSILNIWLE